MLKEILKFFDSYEKIARLYPALVVSAPVVVTCYSFPLLHESPIIKASILIIPFIILMTYVVRFYGKRLEPKLWKQWNGAPSVRYLRRDDLTIAKEVKESFYEKIKNDSGIDLSAESTDQRLTQAFRFVRSELYDKNDAGLWRKFNKEYGFSRNLMGSRSLWVFLSVTGIAVCFFSLGYFPDIRLALIIGCIINCCCLLVAIFCSWYVFPSLIKGIAERYAENAIFSYLKNG